MSDYLKKRMQHILDSRPLPQKKKYRIPTVSEKMKKKIQEARADRGDDKTEKQKWFEAQRPKLTGVCGCGCGQPSMKFDDEKFCFSISHIFPQRIFKSVQFHDLVWVERAWLCHTNMDSRSMERWPGFQDWPEIRRRFAMLSPMLTKQERARKFYRALSELVESNPEQATMPPKI